MRVLFVENMIMIGNILAKYIAPSLRNQPSFFASGPSVRNATRAGSEEEQLFSQAKTRSAKMVKQICIGLILR